MVDYNHPKLSSYWCCIKYSCFAFFYNVLFLINFLIKASYKFQYFAFECLSKMLGITGRCIDVYNIYY